MMYFILESNIYYILKTFPISVHIKGLETMTYPGSVTASIRKTEKPFSTKLKEVSLKKSLISSQEQKRDQRSLENLTVL